jgi:hypothetical protein
MNQTTLSIRPYTILKTMASVFCFYGVRLYKKAVLVKKFWVDIDRWRPDIGMIANRSHASRGPSTGCGWRKKKQVYL